MPERPVLDGGVTVQRIMQRLQFLAVNGYKVLGIRVGAAEWVDLCAAFKAHETGQEPLELIQMAPDGTVIGRIPVELVALPTHLSVHIEGWM